MVNEFSWNLWETIVVNCALRNLDLCAQICGVSLPVWVSWIIQIWIIQIWCRYLLEQESWTSSRISHFCSSANNTIVKIVNRFILWLSCAVLRCIKCQWLETTPVESPDVWLTHLRLTSWVFYHLHRKWHSFEILILLGLVFPRKSIFGFPSRQNVLLWLQNMQQKMHCLIFMKAFLHLFKEILLLKKLYTKVEKFKVAPIASLGKWAYGLCGRPNTE